MAKKVPVKKAVAVLKKSAPRKRIVKALKTIDLDVQVPLLSLDYPQAGENVSSPQYTLRFSAAEGTSFVEVSINDGPWQLCRDSVGFWWFDWSGYESGKHTLRARTVREGREVKFRRVCLVDLSAV